MTTPAHRTPGCPPAATPLVAVVSGLLACAVAAWSTGAMEPLVFVEDSGPLVRWAVPLVRVGHDVAAAVTLGALVFAASIIPDARPTRRGAPRRRSCRASTGQPAGRRRRRTRRCGWRRSPVSPGPSQRSPGWC